MSQRRRFRGRVRGEPGLVARINQFERLDDSLPTLRAMTGSMVTREKTVKRYIVQLSGEARERLDVLIREGRSTLSALFCGFAPAFRKSAHRHRSRRWLSRRRGASMLCSTSTIKWPKCRSAQRCRAAATRQMSRGNVLAITSLSAGPRSPISSSVGASVCQTTPRNERYWAVCRCSWRRKRHHSCR